MRCFYRHRVLTSIDQTLVISVFLMRPVIATSMRVVAICASFTAFANDARAAAPASRSEAAVKPTENGATRRSGLEFGLTFGFGVGSASGTPNSADDLNDSRYYTASGPMFGSQFSLLIMGALADPISVGFFLGGMTFSNSNLQAAASGFGLRVDLFPLAMCDCSKPWMKDIGFASRFGIGSVQLTPKNDPGTKLADGTQSFLSEGIFYDAKVVRMLGGHLSMGPEIDYAVSTSIPAEEHGATLSLRIVFYGGP